MKSFQVIIKKIFVLTLAMFANKAIAQEYHIKVMDVNHQPIEKVQILDKDNKTLGITNRQGEIELKISPQSLPLRLRKLGYEEKEIAELQEHLHITLATKSLSEVTITGNKVEEKRKAGEEVIDKCELGKLACCNLAESLENTNTIDVNYSDGITGGREIQMLALAGSYSQQLNEGLPYHRGILSKIGLELVPGPWIESIGISKGIGSVINGYDNISGAMNIEFLKPKKSLDWFVNGYISEIAKTDLNVVKGFALSDKLHTNILTHASFSRMTMDNNHDGFTDMPVFSNFNIMNKWQYVADNGFRLQAMLQAATYNSEAGQIAHINHYANPYIIKQKHNSYQAQFKTGWELDAVKESSFAVLYKLNYANQNGYIDKRNIDNNQIYLSAMPIYQTNIQSDKNKVKVGYQFIYNNEKENIGSLSFAKKEIVNGAFAEWTGKNNLMTAIVGLRGDYHNELGFFFSPRTTISFHPTDKHTLKFNAGLGFKTPTILTESFGFLVSNRDVIMPTTLQAEKAFSGGLSYKFNYSLLGMKSTLDASYFITLFQNQLIMNLETPELLKIEYLKDNSRAQSFQIDNDIQLSKNFNLRLSYKNDQTIVLYDGVQKMLPLLKTDKYLANLYWVATNQKWRVSTTLLVNGSARIPRMTYSNEQYSPVYPIVHAQLNYVPNNKMDFYIGSENIFAYNQYSRIQSFQNPNLKSFDAGMIWGPMDVRRMYIGGKVTF